MKIAILAAVVAAAATAATATASPFRPAAQGLPFVAVTNAEVQQAPTCQRGLLCYTPQMIQQAYDFPNGRHAPTGAGQTIVVVVAYGSPFIESDLAAFEQQFGLPGANLVQVADPVVTPPDPATAQAWALETSLDVEYAHAMAPDATIVLAVAASDDSSDFVQIEQEALAQYPSAIVTQSFGADETGNASDPGAMAALDALFAGQVANGGTIVASSGDYGASNFTPFADPLPTVMANYPASSPFVLGVGGTQGDPYPGGLWDNGHYGGEAVWNEVLSNGQAGASGGAPSAIYPAPLWQVGLTGSSMRAEPDVAYDAAANGGVIICFGGTFGVIGGTSVGAPQWAAIVALANELRGRQAKPQLGLATPLLYLLARSRSAYRQDFHDITSGSNDLGGADWGLPGFDAGPGYDYPTGLGTPDVARLIKDLSGRDSLHLRLDDLLRHGHGHDDGHGERHVRFGPGR